MRGENDQNKLDRVNRFLQHSAFAMLGLSLHSAAAPQRDVSAPGEFFLEPHHKPVLCIAVRRNQEYTPRWTDRGKRDGVGLIKSKLGGAFTKNAAQLFSIVWSRHHHAALPPADCFKGGADLFSQLSLRPSFLKPRAYQ